MLAQQQHHQHRSRHVKGHGTDASTTQLAARPKEEGDGAWPGKGREGMKCIISWLLFRWQKGPPQATEAPKMLEEGMTHREERKKKMAPHITPASPPFLPQSRGSRLRLAAGAAHAYTYAHAHSALKPRILPLMWRQNPSDSLLEALVAYLPQAPSLPVPPDEAGWS